MGGGCDDYCDRWRQDQYKYGMACVEPWRYKMGPGGHYYDMCCPSISSSCFRNCAPPVRRIVYETVVEEKVHDAYPNFCDPSGCNGFGGGGHGCGGGCGGCGGGHGCGGRCGGRGHGHGHGHGVHDGVWREAQQGYTRSFREGFASSAFCAHESASLGRAPARGDSSYEEWRKTALSASSLQHLES